MSVTGHIDSGQVMLERIQTTVLPGSPSTKIAPMNISTNTVSTPVDRESVDKTKAENGKISNTHRVWTSLLAGAAAGGLAKTTIAPLDRTKINFQISQQPYSAKAAIRFLVNSYKSEGLLSLWRGNSATMVRIVPYAAIQFTAHEQWKRLLGVNGTKTSSAGMRFTAGSLAGVTSQGMTYPLDLVRARMAVTQKAEYKTLRQVFVRMYTEEGILSFYRGFTATILGVIPYAGCSFYTYDTLKSLLVVYKINSAAMATVLSLGCGALAGVVGQTSSYPLDIIRRRMQTSAIKGAHYHTIYSTAVKIYTEEGVMAFFKGLSMNWVKGPVSVGISFATYDLIRDLLRKVIT